MRALGGMTPFVFHGYGGSLPRSARSTRGRGEFNRRVEGSGKESLHLFELLASVAEQLSQDEMATDVKENVGKRRAIGNRSHSQVEQAMHRTCMEGKRERISQEGSNLSIREDEIQTVDTDNSVSCQKKRRKIGTLPVSYRNSMKGKMRKISQEGSNISIGDTNNSVSCQKERRMIENSAISQTEEGIHIMHRYSREGKRGKISQEGSNISIGEGEIPIGVINNSISRRKECTIIPFTRGNGGESSLQTIPLSLCCGESEDVTSSGMKKYNGNVHTPYRLYKTEQEKKQIMLKDSERLQLVRSEEVKVHINNSVVRPTAFISDSTHLRVRDDDGDDDDDDNSTESTCLGKNPQKFSRASFVEQLQDRRRTLAKQNHAELGNHSLNIKHESSLHEEGSYSYSKNVLQITNDFIEPSTQFVNGTKKAPKRKCKNSAEPHVKLSIKSFTIPELYVDLPESATVTNLKKDVMEQAMKLLGRGFCVRVLLQGKKVSDETESLSQVGISETGKLNTISFMLEPVPVSSTNSHEDPLLLLSQATCELKQEMHKERNKDVSCRESPNTDNTQRTNAVKMVPLALTSGTLILHPGSGNQLQGFSLVPVEPKKPIKRRARRPFTVDEVEALVEAVEKLGTGRWRDVKQQAFNEVEHRTYVDLKDKWKSLVHTAQISPCQRRGEPIPQELLDRVLQAALQTKLPLQADSHMQPR